jgi:photosystem II stability/assembly factor-like uncharacterized protein
MKKLTVIFLFAFLFHSNFSNSQWIWQNPTPHGNYTTSICFINNSTGWWFGDLAANYFTTNAGTNWNLQPLTGSPTITCSKYYKFDVNNYTVWIGGLDGKLFKSTNTGLSWNQVTIPNVNVKDIFFLNQNTGYFVASNLNMYKTTNSGNSWDTSLNSWSGIPLYSCYFLNDSIGWATGYNYFYDPHSGPHYETIVYKTTNSGNNWSQIYFAGYWENNMFGATNIYFKDTSEGITWNKDQKLIQKTTDGGINWNYISSDGFIDLVRSNLIYKTGNNKLQKSTDFGNSWIIKDSTGLAGFPQNYIKAYDSTLILIEGTNGYVKKTTNEGNNWADCKKYITTNNIKFIYPRDSLVLYAFTSNGFGFKTTNGGNVWTALDSSNFANGKPSCISFTNSNTGWIGCKLGKVLKTTNGGTNWIQYLTPSDTNITYIKVFDNGTGYAYDESYRIIKTTNSGINWTISSNFSPHFIQAINSETIYRMDILNFAKFSKSTDGGLSWSTVYSFGSQKYGYHFYFINSNYGYSYISERYSYTGYYNYCYKTTNSGLNWIYLAGYPDYGDEITSTIVDSNILYTTSGSNTFLYTTNGGINWTTFPRLSSYQIRSIAIFKKNIWIAGDNGMIMKGANLVPIIINNISSKIPDKLLLFQNYPNPFNPKTIIRFQIKDSRFVSLKVYDLLGKEVAKLVNEKQAAGTYEVSFDGENLASGIYFYSLYIDGIRFDTKRMVLIK